MIAAAILLQAAVSQVPVVRGNLSPVLEAEGTLVAERPLAVKVRPEAYAGRMVLAERAAAGGAVRRGDLLARLDSDIGWSIREAELTLAEAKDAQAAALSEEKLGAARAALARADGERAVTRAKEALEYFDARGGKDLLRRAELGLAFYEHNVADQEEELKQLEKMYKSEELTSDTAEVVVMRARRSLAQARATVELEREEARVTREVDHPRRRQDLEAALKSAQQSQAELIARQAGEAAVWKRAVEKAALGLEKAERGLARLRQDEAAFTMRAPHDGFVLVKAGEGADPEAGDTVSPGQTLLTLVAPGTLVARVEAPESVALDAAGRKATVRIKALPGKPLEAEVALVEHKTLTLRVAGLDARLRPGFAVTARVPLPERKGVLLVPAAAVGADGTVKLAGGGSRKVVTGAGDGARTEIVDGLAEGESVVVPE